MSSAPASICATPRNGRASRGSMAAISAISARPTPWWARPWWGSTRSRSRRRRWSRRNDGRAPRLRRRLGPGELLEEIVLAGGGRIVVGRSGDGVRAGDPDMGLGDVVLLQHLQPAIEAHLGPGGPLGPGAPRIAVENRHQALAIAVHVFLLVRRNVPLGNALRRHRLA